MAKEKIAVIGGGVLGCALCWRLAKAGFPVVLLERGCLASGASGGNLSQISIVDRLEDWHIAVTLHTLNLYRELKERYGLDYHASGGATVLRNDTEMEAAAAAAAALQAYGIPGRVVTGKAGMAAIEPELDPKTAMGLLHCGWEGKVDAFSATLLFARLAKEAGAHILAHAEVTGFGLRGQSVHSVTTTRGVFEADVVINAGGPWSDHVAGLAGVELPVLCRHRGSALVSRPMPPVVRSTVVGGGFLLSEAAGGTAEGGLRIGLGLLQNAHGSIFLSQATLENAANEREVDLKSMVLIARQAIRYFPRLEHLEILRAWSAPTTYTLDGAPLFGFSEKLENLFICTGFKGAFSTALGVAEEAVNVFKGQAPAIGGFAAPERSMVRAAARG